MAFSEEKLGLRRALRMIRNMGVPAVAGGTFMSGYTRALEDMRRVIAYELKDDEGPKPF